MKKSLFWLSAMLVSLSHSQVCVAPTSGQWSLTPLTSDLTHPVAMGIVPEDGTVFVAEMWSGNLKRFIPGQGIKTLKSLDVYIDKGRTSHSVAQPASRGIENGLLGVAVDSRFSEKKWIYLLYSKRLSTQSNTNVGDSKVHKHEHVLSRFTVSGDTLMSEKVILKIPRLTARHAGGGIDFNPRTGELYIGTGDDRYPSDNRSKWGPRQDGASEAAYDALETSANTNDLRGKVLRIKPIGFADYENPAPGIGSTYEIPKGNLFEKPQYVGADRFIRREIYSMGHRNPYHVRVDPYTGWAMVGDVGPDAGSDANDKGLRGHDEFNLITEAANFGWPFAIANNRSYKVHDGEASAYTRGDEFDLNNLVNESVRNTGLKQLPPGKAALGWYTADGKQTGSLENTNLNQPFGGGGESAIGGPVYHYDEDLSSSVKWPAYYNGKAIVGDYKRNKVYALELSENKSLKKVEVVRSGLSELIDLDMGPKGELYVLQYGSGKLSKLEYTGNQYSASSCTHYVGPRAPDTVQFSGIGSVSESHSQSIIMLHVASELLPTISFPRGATQVRFLNLQGKELAVLSNSSKEQNVPLPQHLKDVGVLFVKFEFK